MKRIHCLNYGGDEGKLGELITTATSRGLRLGFLDLETQEQVALYQEQVTPWAKIVQVGERANLTLKRRRGPWILKDLLREHFRGFDLVLVKGAAEFPELSVVNKEWLLSFPGKKMRLSTDRLLDRLSRVSLE